MAKRKKHPDKPANVPKLSKLHAALIEFRQLGRKKGRVVIMHGELLAKCLDITTTDMACIDYILDKGQATPTELAKITGLTTGAITGVINRLEKKNYVTYERDKKDKRKVIVKGVPRTMSMYTYCWQPLAEKLFKLLSTYNLKQMEFLNEFHRDALAIYEEVIDEMSKEDPRQRKNRSAWLNTDHNNKF